MKDGSWTSFELKERGARADNPRLSDRQVGLYRLKIVKAIPKTKVNLSEYTASADLFWLYNQVATKIVKNLSVSFHMV